MINSNHRVETDTFVSKTIGIDDSFGESVETR